MLTYAGSMLFANVTELVHALYYLGVAGGLFCIMAVVLLCVLFLYDRMEG